MGTFMDFQMINQNNFEMLFRQKLQAKFHACFTNSMIVLLSLTLVDCGQAQA